MRVTLFAADVFGALARGCSSTLEELDLTGNKFAKKTVGVPPALDQYFTTTTALRRLDLSQTRLPAELLEVILSRLERNRKASYLGNGRGGQRGHPCVRTLSVCGRGGQPVSPSWL